jgi:hypothetical protein
MICSLGTFLPNRTHFTMSDLRFDDYADELAELFTTEQTCLGCLADEPGQEAHMGFGGCLSYDYDYDYDEHGDESALPEPLSDEQLSFLQNIVVPEGIHFCINGHLISPGTAVTDALSAFGEGNDYDEEECYGCWVDSMGRSDHTGVNGCLSDYGGCC